MSAKVKEWTVLSMLEWGTAFFKEKNIPDPRLSIEWLLAITLDIKRLDLYLKYDRPLSSSELDKLRALVKRRAKHEPLQYITGYTEFMNVRILVNEDVLIPRIETEQLVEIVLDENSKNESITFLDIGTGSGCIPVALKKERPEWNAFAVDNSGKALKIARANAEKNEVAINFARADILKPKKISPADPFDFIISNPPYIIPDEKDMLELQVKKYEPHEALFVSDMNNMYQSIITFARENLKESGKLYLEIHELYAEQISTLFDPQIWGVTLRKDYDKKQRFIIAKRR